MSRRVRVTLVCELGAPAWWAEDEVASLSDDALQALAQDLVEEDWHEVIARADVSYRILGDFADPLRLRQAEPSA
jgi:hypothetical protein